MNRKDTMIYMLAGIGVWHIFEWCMLKLGYGMYYFDHWLDLYRGVGRP